MMLVSAAALLAVSAGCVAWYFLHARDVRTTVSQRLSSIPQNFAFPYNFNTSQSTTSAATAGITLEESLENKFLRKLYLAGMRSKKVASYMKRLPMFCWVLGALTLGLGLMSGKMDLPLLGRAAAIAFGIPFMVNIMINGRRKKFEKGVTRSLPQLLDLVIVSMEAGLNFTAALPRVMKEMDPNDPLIKEFRILNHEYLGGLSFSQSCLRMVKRCDVADLALILNAVAESEETGTSLAHVLRIHADELRDKRRQRLREAAHKLPIKLIFPMMLVFITIFSIAIGPSVYRLKSYMKTGVQVE